MLSALPTYDNVRFCDESDHLLFFFPCPAALPVLAARGVNSTGKVLVLVAQGEWYHSADQYCRVVLSGRLASLTHEEEWSVAMVSSVLLEVEICC